MLRSHVVRSFADVATVMFLSQILGIRIADTAPGLQPCTAKNGTTIMQARTS